MSIARIVVLAIALTHVVGLADVVMGDACDEVCTDDGCGKDCLPGVSCRCHCPSTMPALGGAAQAGVMDPPDEIDPCSIHQRMHASPDPREILHVPKRFA